MILKYFQYLKENLSNSDFKIGDVVVCVDNSGAASFYFEKNKLYEVIGVYGGNDNCKFLNFNHASGVLSSRFKKIDDIEKFKIKKQEEINKHRHIDPYGEENWFEYESVNHSEKEIFEPGDFVYCIDFSGYAGKFFEPGKYYEIQDVEYDNFDHNLTLLFFDIGINKGWHSDKFKKVDDESLMGDIKKRKIELNKVHKEIDPYGEDEWENENYKMNEQETSSDYIKEGDWVYCVDNTNSIELKYNTHYEVKNTFYIRDNKFLDLGGNIGKWSACRFRKAQDISTTDKFNIKKQESIDKHRRIVPYGEDDWLLDENINIHDNKFKVGDKVICIIDNNNSMLHLNNIYEVSYVGNEYIRLKETGDAEWFKSRFKNLSEEEYSKKLEDYLEKNKDIDPYGEEFSFYDD